MKFNDKIDYEKQECPICMEYLKFNKKGVMKHNKTGEIIYTFSCEECNQSFALDENNGQMKIISYDSDMKLIENKCKICNIVENYNEKGLFLLNKDTAHYEFYCFDCAIPVLQEWANKNCKKVSEVNTENIQEFYQIYDFYKNNEMLQEMNSNPNKFAKLRRKIKKELDGLNSQNEPEEKQNEEKSE